MNKKEIKKQYLKKIEDYINYNKSYYEKSQPLVDDQYFDKLKKEILLFENKYKFLRSKNSPSKIVGFKPSKNFKKQKHRVPMLSLSNAFSLQDLLNFEKKNIEFYF